MAVIIDTVVFWVVETCSLVGGWQHFVWLFGLLLHSQIEIHKTVNNSVMYSLTWPVTFVALFTRFWHWFSSRARLIHSPSYHIYQRFYFNIIPPCMLRIRKSSVEFGIYYRNLCMYFSQLPLLLRKPSIYFLLIS